MSEFSNNEQMLDMYLFESFQNIEQLESCILDSEKSNGFSPESINEIFRIMHTIKGSSAMMLFNSISTLAHSMEDLFYFIREQKPKIIDTTSLSDLLLEGVDFIKVELIKIKEHDFQENGCTELVDRIKNFLLNLKEMNKLGSTEERPIGNEKLQYYIVPDTVEKIEYSHCYKAVIFYEDRCEMENLRAYTVVHNLKQFTNELVYFPKNIEDDENTIQEIREKGFTIYCRTNKNYDEMEHFFQQTIFLKSLELTEIEDMSECDKFIQPENKTPVNSAIKMPQHKSNSQNENKEKESHSTAQSQNIISINLTKLDKLMDLIGEMVISEALVSQNPDLDGLELDNFQKAARQHHKIITEVQDLVMSIRMVPLAPTFQKMHRIVRDMNKNLNKETELVLIGGEIEVDKNIIEHISDPMMHLVRNCIDHGIETPAYREGIGKDRAGKITIEARNSGNDVIIKIADDGKGLDKNKILAKAREHGLLNGSANDMSDREIYNLILLPGFSTKDDVNEYSGRGVGMDVVKKNIEEIGGTVLVDSFEGNGTVITLKIPLTLAIIDGMNVRVGDARYTIPIMAIKESFQPETSDIITDPDGNEMIMVRGNCYSIKRLHRLFCIDTDIIDFKDGILIMVEQDEKSCCIFVDDLLGQQQVVVKTLPDFIKEIKKITGIAGCTLLGDGNISLILDIAGIIS